MSERRVATGSRKREAELPERFEELAARVRQAWGLHRVNPERHVLHRIGRFEALRRIGQGGFGVVYKVRDPELGREVALKLFPTPGPAAAEAFSREAQLLARFSHPHIVRVFEAGRHGDDFFFVMELIDGFTGDQFIDRWVDIDEVLEVYQAAGAGLAAAHAQGIVHRDFKPSNILLGHDGRVCVADFGLAGVVADRANIGTFPYMAPELLRGEPGDARADQWSFCVALWETLHGTRPFAGDTAEELLAAIERGPEAGELADDVPDAVRAVVRIGLSMEPADRHADMPTLIAALHRLRVPITTTEPARPRKAFFWAMLVGFGVMLGAIGSAFVPGDRVTEEPTPAETTPAEPTPVTDPVVQHVLELIAADEFERAYEIWEREIEHRKAMGILTHEDSLRIAQAFSDRAAALAQRDPMRANAAALRAYELKWIASDYE